ncbi:MAG: 2-oxoglutarate dehydrogenase complex dihydrolipoyllysine-residue succinyltransferase [Alphaproteobacteria bacterium]|jgi:2-oxoglutarate dehydrogenase E2 component (dihydrolipoamide succinyltransferase)|nr:2-oxoglutarate dehydrogenase complex dihydrolipoyllysine-residue succinyltransferase [Alphaproteobacteria bacterium]
MSSISIKVPALGESVTEATVAKWLKQPGDAVKVDEPLVELETDKVTQEVYAPAAGVLSEVLVKQGQSVPIGAVLGSIAEGAAAAASAKPVANDTAAKPAPVAAPAAAPSAPVMMPSAAKLAAEQNINPASLSGTGKDGRILKEDVQRGASAPAVAPAPVSSYSASTASGSREERVKMSRLRSRIAERLKEAQNTAAILTTFNEIDMGAVMELRAKYKDEFEKRHGVKLGFMGFFAKAAIQALQEIPAVNAEISGDEIIYKNHYDIGVAVGTDAGLVVPVLRDADTLSVAGIEKGIADLATKARTGKLGIADMQGGTFTITNGGIYGSLMSTPIINPPQSGILGLHKIQDRPMAVKGAVVVRPMMYVALSYDHRIIDGKEAVTFLVRVKEAMEDPGRLLLAV